MLLPTDWDDVWELIHADNCAADMLPLLQLAPVVDIHWVLPALYLLLLPISIGHIMNLDDWRSFDPAMQRKFIVNRDNCVSALTILSIKIQIHSPSCLSANPPCRTSLALLQNIGLWGRVMGAFKPPICCKKCFKIAEPECYTAGEGFWLDVFPNAIGLEPWADLIRAKESFDN